MRRWWHTGLVALAVGAAGCGEERSGAPPETAAVPAGVTLVAALGDSITAGTPFFDPYAPNDMGDPAAPWTATAQRRHPGHRFRNCGIAGESTFAIRERLDACAKGAKILIVQGGINDIAQGGGVEDAAANLRAMVREGKSRGMRVGIVEVLPWTNGHPEAAPVIDDLNRRIRELAREEGATLSPWYRVLEDPARPGRFRPALTAEGDHPSKEGYRLLGEAFRLPGR